MRVTLCLILSLSFANASRKNGLRTVNVHPSFVQWPDPSNIPFYFDQNYTSSEKETISQAMMKIMQDLNSCIVFQPIESNSTMFKVKVTPFKEDNITPAEYCSGYAGKFKDLEIAGKTEQRLVLARAPTGCLDGTKHSIMKYFAMLLGKRNEHQRGDRDKYIRLDPTALIAPEYMTSAYRIYSPLEANWSMSAYDYCSITHNRVTDFARPGREAFEVLYSPKVIPALDRLSNTDCQLISNMYGCNPYLCEPLNCAVQQTTTIATTKTSTTSITSSSSSTKSSSTNSVSTAVATSTAKSSRVSESSTIPATPLSSSVGSCSCPCSPTGAVSVTSSSLTASSPVQLSASTAAATGVSSSSSVAASISHSATLPSWGPSTGISLSSVASSSATIFSSTAAVSTALSSSSVAISSSLSSNIPSSSPSTWLSSSSVASSTQPSTSPSTAILSSASPFSTTSSTALSTKGSTCVNGQFTDFCTKAPTLSLLYRVAASSANDVYIAILGNCAMTYSITATDTSSVITPATADNLPNPAPLDTFYANSVETVNAFGRSLPIRFGYFDGTIPATIMSDPTWSSQAIQCEGTTFAGSCVAQTLSNAPISGLITTAAAPQGEPTTIIGKQFYVYLSDTKQICASNTPNPTSVPSTQCFTLTDNIDPITTVTALQYVNDPNSPSFIVFGTDSAGALQIAMADAPLNQQWNPPAAPTSFPTYGGAFRSDVYTTGMGC